MTAGPLFTVDISDEAKERLWVIARNDKRIATKLADFMEDLNTLPEQKGRPLSGELSGLYSRHVIGNRFRIIYEIDRTACRVSVVSVGIREAGSRRDIYKLTKKIKARRKV